MVVEDGKTKKVPCNIYGIKIGTDEKYKQSWVTYEEAINAKNERGFSGIGFIIQKGYFFLDVDKRPIDDSLMQTLFNRFDSYTEYSVSGTGTHIYGKCEFDKIPTYIGDDGKIKLNRAYYQKNPNNKIELYMGGITNRFAVYTGNVIFDKPLKECTTAVLTTLEKNMQRKKRVNFSPKADDDRELFDIICNLRKAKNKEKFIKLFDEGDTSGYESTSEAELALCSIMAFRTGNNPDLLDKLFRQSALMRDKWEREDYRDNTLEKAIEICDGNFHRSVMPDKPPFILFKGNGMPTVNSALLAEHIRNTLDYILVRDNAKGATLIYVYENGCYRHYGMNMFKGIVKKYITDYDLSMLRMSDVAATIEHLITDLNTLTNDDLNTDEEYINFTNGLLRLSDLEIIPHSPKILSTIQIPCQWSGKPTATPVFDSYIDTLTSGNRDITNLLLEFIGAIISNVPGYKMKKALFLVGLGDTGKSQLKRLVEWILGKSNYIGIDLNEIEARFGTSAIYGKRLSGSSDMSFVTVNELKTFKKCTGGDSLFAEFKGENSFEFIYNGFLWFCMNRLPKFGGDDGKWVYERIIHIECNNVIPKDKQDKYLLEKMYEEREGIIYKAVMAFRNVVNNGYAFSEPDEIISAREDYRNNNSTVVSFFTECMEEREDGKITDNCTTGRVYKVYKAWCKDNNNGYAKTARDFREELSSHLNTDYQDLVVRRGRVGNFYSKYTLSNDAKTDYKETYGYDFEEFL